MKEMISIIAAMDEKRGIGKNNDLLFRIQEDFERMRRLTKGHPLVMGRKTFESIEGGVVDRLYLTKVEGDWGANTFFPDYSQFKKVIHEEAGTEGEYKFRFIDLE